MFYFHLNPSDGCLHLQVYHALRRSMLSGVLPEGMKLPSKRCLAKDLGVSINTVETAYAQLELEGYILRRERVGSFVQALDHQLILPQQNLPHPLDPLHSPLEPLYDFFLPRRRPSCLSLWHRV